MKFGQLAVILDYISLITSIKNELPGNGSLRYVSSAVPGCPKAFLSYFLLGNLLMVASTDLCQIASIDCPFLHSENWVD